MAFWSECLGFSDEEAGERLARIERRVWWHGFWWGALCGVWFMTMAAVVDVWLKH